VSVVAWSGRSLRYGGRLFFVSRVVLERFKRFIHRLVSATPGVDISPQMKSRRLMMTGTRFSQVFERVRNSIAVTRNISSGSNYRKGK
jgi:hypothetical protein